MEPPTPEQHHLPPAPPPPLPPLLPPPHLENYSSLAFESLNTPAFQTLPTPIAACFGVGIASGLNVHIGWEATDVSVVFDSQVRMEYYVRVEVGTRDCLRYLKEILLKDPVIKARLEELSNGTKDTGKYIELDALADELAEVVLLSDKGQVNVPLANGQTVPIANEKEGEEEEEGVFNVAKELTKADASKTIAQIKEARKKGIPPPTTSSTNPSAPDPTSSTSKTNPTAPLPTDTIRLYLPSLPSHSSYNINVGPIRHRACEPLYTTFDGVQGGYGGGRTVQEGIAASVEGIEDASVRGIVWDGVVVTGELARLPSLPIAIASHLNGFLASSPDSDVDQANRIKVLRLPDYFTNFQGQPTDLAPFLGASIAAKIIFSDGNKQCVTKSDYNAYGPAAIHVME